MRRIRRAIAAALACVPATVAGAPGEGPPNPAMAPPPGAALEAPAAEPIPPEEPRSGPDLPSTNLPGALELHRPNYIMPLTWTDDAQGNEDAELKFQISLKHQVGDFPLYFGYTQTAYWRWLDEEDSSPFREINFNPELWYRVRPGRLPGDALDWLGIDAGYEHESNGETLPESKSWTASTCAPGWTTGAGARRSSSGTALPEDPKTSPSDPSGDDNPEILDYYGHHELKVGYTFADGDWAELTTRYASSDDRGAIRLRYAAPTPTRDSYFFAELFSGYGESLETFKQRRHRIGIGFALLR
ncbi:MAG: phospholipase A [Halofilum sp. (in: g-proteobacteria)]|nr:phospholipase A [Halofilum sp. (in: g-proteobacteria)]